MAEFQETSEYYFPATTYDHPQKDQLPTSQQPDFFEPYDQNLFYQADDLTLATTAINYTPSYGSPHSSVYESMDSSSSISDYEPSDGYSSCDGSSGLASPNLPVDIQFSDEMQMLGNYDNYDVYQMQQDFGMTQDIKMESFGGLKLNTTNLSNLSPDNDEANNPEFLESLACMQQDNPVFSFIPPTPLSPTKNHAIPSNFYAPPQSVITDRDLPSVNPSESVNIGNTNSTASYAANYKSDQIPRSTPNLHSHNSNSSNTHNPDSTVLTPSSSHTHRHRSHRKQLPQDMAERLHTMNLAPPKPQRKSKTSAPFHCPYEDCPKTFTRQYNLKSHLRTHTDERPFLCGYQGCTRAFARQHDRKRHYNLHLGFKPHVCSHCGRAFARLDALNRHLRSDSGAPCAQATLPNGGAKKFKPVNL